MKLPPFVTKQPVGANPMHDTYDMGGVEDLLKSFQKQNSGSSRAKVMEALQDLNNKGRFRDGAYAKALELVPKYFPLSGGKRKSKSKSRRSKKRSNKKTKKTNASRRR